MLEMLLLALMLYNYHYGKHDQGYSHNDSCAEMLIKEDDSKNYGCEWLKCSHD